MATIRLGYPGYNGRCAKLDKFLMKRFGGFGGKRGWGERLGKKYNWIILKQLMGQLIDQKRMGSKGKSLNSDVIFEVMAMRDIDPTDLRLNLKEVAGVTETYTCKTYTDLKMRIDFKDWCIKRDLGDITKFLKVQDSQNSDFLCPKYVK